MKTIKSENVDSIQEQQIIQFIKMFKLITFLMPEANYETFAFDLLSLANIIEQRGTTRRKRAALVQNKDLGFLDMEYLKTVLSLSEILLNSKNATVAQTERSKIVKKIHKFVMKMCRDPLKNGQIIGWYLPSTP